MSNTTSEGSKVLTYKEVAVIKGFADLMGEEKFLRLLHVLGLEKKMDAAIETFEPDMKIRVSEFTQKLAAEHPEYMEVLEKFIKLSDLPGDWEFVKGEDDSTKS